MKFFVFVFIFILTFLGQAQVVNGYVNVVSIAGSTINVDNVNEGGDTFEDGEQVIIMQMQDNVIGGNTGDNSSFGLLGSVTSAGLYEVVTVVSHVESGSLPTSFTISSTLSNTYNVGANASVQIISFPELGSPNYTNGNITALNWDGTIGGVVAFQVSGTLTIGGDISSDLAGFRGASANAGASAGCTGGSNFRVANGANSADKGEGIYRSTNANYVAGRARILNGGGGGNSHNAGGGGGGNYSAGGLGGPGWPGCSPTAGGMGGIDLSANISAARIFMGGGGGAGEGNNGGSQVAEDGGGIVFIKANNLVTTGSCGSGYVISANGGSVTTGSGGDGNSGGGAGGSIVLEIGTWSVVAACPLLLEANGGNGGDVTHSAGHGAGGGGGQGVIIYSIAEPTSNTTTNTNNGNGGLNCNTCSTAGSGSGSNGSGIIDNSSGPLPIELVNYTAELIGERSIKLSWETKSEVNSDFFIIEHSEDADKWQQIIKTKAVEYSSANTIYVEWDYSPSEWDNYYRLTQVDLDGRANVEGIQLVKLTNNQNGVKVYPLPAGHFVYVESEGYDLIDLQMFNAVGQNVTGLISRVKLNDSKYYLNISQLSAGVYYLNTENILVKIFKN